MNDFITRKIKEFREKFKRLLANTEDNKFTFVEKDVEDFITNAIQEAQQKERKQVINQINSLRMKNTLDVLNRKIEVPSPLNVFDKIISELSQQKEV